MYTAITMFWGDAIAHKVKERYGDVITRDDTIVIRDEKTASGPVHVGSLRSAMLHGIVPDILSEEHISSTFKFEINDFDPMDGIPASVDEKTYAQYLGMPLNRVPSPVSGYENFAEYYGTEYVDVLQSLGFELDVYRASELYNSGAMNEMIRLALTRRDMIRDILKRMSGSERPADWHPINVVCEQCGKLSTTRVTDFDGETVAYTCAPDVVTWADGCGHEGRISPFDGNAKFPWKVDWAAKFVVVGPHFEGGGKDHYTKGGARQVSEAICREVFEHEPPYGTFNEFFLVGGKKMSSSKGNAATATEMAELLPAHILRLLLIKTPINRQLNFDPNGDSVPILYDTYDRLAEKYFTNVGDDDARIFYLAHKKVDRAEIVERFLPRFSQVAYMVQMPHIDVEAQLQEMKGGVLTDADRNEYEERARYARHWLAQYADEKFIFAVQDTVPASTQSLSSEQVLALQTFADRLQTLEIFDGQSIHEVSHTVKEECGLAPKAFFGAVYTAFLGKESGPKLGWFLSTFDREFVVNRLQLKA